MLSASSDKAEKPLFTRLIACVRSQNSEQKLAERFSQHLDKLVVSHSNNVQAVQASDIIILGTDPADIETVLRQPGLREALANKLLISIAAGWTREKLEQVLYGSETRARNTSERAWVVRALPNIAAQVSESLTAIEMSEPAVPEPYIQITNAIFQQIGRTVHVDPRLMNATAVAGGGNPSLFCSGMRCTD